MSSMKVGIVGVGEIGKMLALNAVGAGHRVCAYDQRPSSVAELQQSGVTGAASLADLARRSDVVQIAVMDDAQVRAVCSATDGLLAHLQPGSLLVVHSTVHPQTVRDLAAACAGRALHVLDAAVTSAIGPRGLSEKSATFLVGGDAAQLTRLRPLLLCSAQHVFHLGGFGAGMQAKILRNFTMYVTLLAARETRGFAAALGIEPETLRAMLAASGASSTTMDHYLSRRDYDAAYRDRLPALTAIFEKDLSLAIEIAQQHGIDLRSAKLARQCIADILLPADAVEV